MMNGRDRTGGHCVAFILCGHCEDRSGCALFRNTFPNMLHYDTTVLSWQLVVHCTIVLLSNLLYCPHIICTSISTVVIYILCTVLVSSARS